jgi:hypothetical protein
MPLSEGEIATVKGMLVRGDKQHDIASWFGVNAARVNEIHSGQTGAGVAAAAGDQLPPRGPYMAGRSANRARDTLVALRELIDEAISDIDLYEIGEK